MTSNLGATLPHGASVGFSQEQSQFAAGSVERAVGRAFRREFVNRIDRVVVFRPLGRGVMRDLLRKELNDVLTRRGLRTRQWAVEWDESAVEFLLEKGFTADLGARPLKRAVERYLLSPLAITIVNHQFPEGDQFLFVRSSPDAQTLDVQFVDPDAPAEREAEVEEVDEPFDEEAARELRLESVALDPKGTPEELRFLQEQYEEVAAQVDADVWRERKEAALGEMQTADFWSSPSASPCSGRSSTWIVSRPGSTRPARSSRVCAATGGGSLPTPSRDSPNSSTYLMRPAAVWPRGSRATPSCSSPRGASPAPTARGATTSRARSGACTDAGPNGGGCALSRSKSKTARARTARARRSIGRSLPSPATRPTRFSGTRRAFTSSRRHRTRGRPSNVRPPRFASSASPKSRRGAAGASPCANRPSTRSRPTLMRRKRQIVRRYREEPSPLVRDSARGWRTGRLERVLDGDFDLMG